MKLQKNLTKRHPQADLQSDSKTLRYELENLIGIAREYSPGLAKTHPIRNNAYVEAFAVHCRALIYFLYGHLVEIAANGKAITFSNPRPNDVLAFDFHQAWDKDCPLPTEIMIDSKLQTDKHVAHITTDRRDVNQAGSTKLSVWQLSESVSAICVVMDSFLQLAAPRNFDPSELKRMRELIVEWSNLIAPATTRDSTPPIYPDRQITASWLQGRTDARTLSPEPGLCIHGETE